MIGELQKNRYESGIITDDGNDNIINYSFFIFIDLINPFCGGYLNYKCLHKEGNNRNFDFSNTIRDLYQHVFASAYSVLDNISDVEPLKISGPRPGGPVVGVSDS